MRTLFQKILEEKMGLEISQESAPKKTIFSSRANDFYFFMTNVQPKSSFQKFESSTYIRYQKDPKEIEQHKIQREKMSLDAFLNKMPSENAKKAVENFYKHGGRRFLSGKASDLKKDFRIIAKQVHPDAHPLVSEGKKQLFAREFHQMREDFNLLNSIFSSTK